MNEQQYDTILGLLADKVKEQSETIALQGYHIETLKKKLAEAEIHLNHLEKERSEKNEIR